MQVGARAEKTGLFGSTTDKNKQRAQTRMLKIKKVFETVEKLIAQPQSVAKLDLFSKPPKNTKNKKTKTKKRYFENLFGLQKE